MDAFLKLYKLEPNQPLIKYKDAITISDVTFISSSYNLNLIPLLMLKSILCLKPNSRVLAFSSLRFPESPVTEDYDPLNDDVVETDHSIHNSNNPMDVFIYLFLQSDPLFRPIFVNQVSKCQFALPLVVVCPQNKLPVYYGSIYQNMIKTYTTPDGKFHTIHVADTNMPIISFIRIGKCSRSYKSSLLNSIFGFSHDCFFSTKNSKNSCKSRLLYDGTIEMNWYLPRGNAANDFILEPILFLNLRGNAFDNEIQLNYIMNASTIVYIVITMQDMNQNEVSELRRLSDSFSNKICLIFTDWKLQSQETKDIYKNTLPKYKSNMYNAFAEDNLNLLTGAIQNSINFYIKSNNSLISLSGEENIVNLGFYCDTKFENRLEKCNLRTLILKDHFLDKIFEIDFARNNLPLQTEGWRRYATADRQRAKNKQQHKSFNFALNLINIKAELSAARKCQRDYLKNTPHPLFVYGHSFMKVEDIELTQLMWETLKIELEKICFCIPTGASNPLRLGIQNIIREIGQYYETYSKCNDFYRKAINNNNVPYTNPLNLPKLFASLLLEGQPLEILDGDVQHVPIGWVRSVLNALANIVGIDKKIYVLGVLGIQSSGKSTLLNTMFGLQFPVSSGRCTRGVSMQIITIDSSCDLPYDYVIILDSEGLKAPEIRDEDRTAHDNELATFVIGISDLTMVNIMGENQVAWQEIFQIIILALARLQVSINKPKCVFVHQNIPSQDAREALNEGYEKFILKLDEVTRYASEKEKSNKKFSKFTDLIDFNLNNSVYFFPPLFKSLPPMSIVSNEYSEMATELKLKIIDGTSKLSSSFNTINQWSNNVETVWSALLKENFIFCYRNIKERMCYTEFQNSLNEWSHEYKIEMEKYALQIRDEILSANYNEISGKVNEFDINFETACLNTLKAKETEFTKIFFSDSPYADIYQQWEVEATAHFRTTRQEQRLNMTHKLRTYYRIAEKNNPILDSFNKKRDQILKRVKKSGFLKFLESKAITNTIVQEQYDEAYSVDALFESEWKEWSADILEVNEAPPEIDYLFSLRMTIDELYKLYDLSTDERTLINNQLDLFKIKSSPFESFIIGNKHFCVYNINLNKMIYLYLEYDSWGDYLNCLRSPLEPKPDATSHTYYKRIKTLLELIIAYVKEYVNSISIELLQDADCINRVICIICESIVDFNEGELSNTNFQITVNSLFILELVLFCSFNAIHSFKQQFTAYWEDINKKQQMESLKMQLKSIFTDFYQPDKFSANLTCSNLLANILHEKMNNYIKDELELALQQIFDDSIYSFNSKSQLQVHYLTKLAKEGTFDLYLQYITNPNDELKKEFAIQFDAFSKDEAINAKLLDTIKSKSMYCIEQYSNFLQCSLQTTHQPSELAESSNSKPTNIIAPNWTNTFFEKVNHILTRNFSLDDLKPVELLSQDIDNPDEFIALFNEALSLKSCPEDYQTLKKNAFSAETFCNKYYEKLFICYECCPLCNEPCVDSVKSHEKHMCGMFHRPLGLNGWYHRDTNEFIACDCPNFAKKDLPLRHNIDQKKNEMEISGYVEPELTPTGPNMDECMSPSWDINQAETYIHYEYWEYVLSKYQDEFIDHFKYTSNVNAIDAWSHIKENVAIDSINTLYKQFNKPSIFWRIKKKIVNLFTAQIS